MSTYTRLGPFLFDIFRSKADSKSHTRSEQRRGQKKRKVKKNSVANVHTLEPRKDPYLGGERMKVRKKGEPGLCPEFEGAKRSGEPQAAANL